MLPMALDFSLDAMSLLGFSLPVGSNRNQHPPYQYPGKKTMGLTIKIKKDLSDYQ